MGALLSFLNASPARIQALAIGALAIAVLCLALTAWALLERSWRFQALDQRDRARDQATVLAASVKACTAGVELARKAGEDGRALGRRLLSEAQRLNAGNAATVSALEQLLEKPAKPGASCEDAWREIEALHRKTGAPQ